MELKRCIDDVVHAGVQAYIGLLCYGEQSRSRRVLTDTMQISSLASGGPSARFPVTTGIAETSPVSLARCLTYFTLRSLLASLLVLRATDYWSKVPALEELHQACAALGRCLGEAGHDAPLPDGDDAAATRA